MQSDDRVPVAEDQLPVLAQRGGERRDEQAELGHLRERSLARVDDREAARPELERELVQLRLEERARRDALAGDRERLARTGRSR